MSKRHRNLRSHLSILTVAAGLLMACWVGSQNAPPAQSVQAARGYPLSSLTLKSGASVRFVISPLGSETGFEESGGNLVGIELDGGDLEFGSMTTFFDRAFPRQGRYSRVSFVAGRVISHGLDSGNPEVEVETVWAPLPPSNPGVRGQLSITTTVRNRGDTSLDDFELGDIISWGDLQHFAPGPGTALAGLDEELDWVGASSEQGALLVAGFKQLSGPHGSSWSDPIWKTVSVPPQGEATFERRILVGDRLGDLVGAALDLQGRKTVIQPLSAVEHETERPLSGVLFSIDRVVMEGDFRPAQQTRADANGEAWAHLEPGRYRLRANSPSRFALQEQLFEVGDASPVPQRVALSRPGSLLIALRDPAGQLIPGRVDFTGVGDTEAPNFGPPSRSISLNRAYVLGEERIAIPPGEYQVTVSHGPAWSIHSTHLTVPPASDDSEPERLRVTLRPLVTPAGWLHCDFHQHASYSPDSAVRPVDGLVASAAEGLDCIATTDHDAVADWRPHLKAAGLEDSMLWLPGIEVTSESIGHYNAFPWTPQLGTVAHRGRTSKQVVTAMRERAPDALIQLNHPLWGAIGLWNLVGLDPSTGRPLQASSEGLPTEVSEDFDLIEVLNGKDIEHSEKTLQAWLKLLGSSGGKAPRAVGNSDSHRLVGQERGASRTWVHDCSDAEEPGRSSPSSLSSPEELVAAVLKPCRMTASSGPFLDLRRATNNEDPGATFGVLVEMQAPEWMKIDHIEVYSGSDEAPGFKSLGQWSPGLPPLSVTAMDEAQRWALPLTLPHNDKGNWLVAVARGTEPMLPWSDAQALAVTSPLQLSP